MTSVGIIGGTGPQGRGLAARLAEADRPVMLGSRDRARGEAVAAELGGNVTGGANLDVCRDADVVIAAVPYAGLAETVIPLRDALAGKVVLSCVNALAFDAAGPWPVHIPEGSIAELLASLLPEARVATAFNTVSAAHLRGRGELDDDVPVAGDDDHAVTTGVALADAVPGLRGVAVGPLRLAGTIEGLVGVILNVNRRYKISAGIRFTGLP